MSDINFLIGQYLHKTTQAVTSSNNLLDEAQQKAVNNILSHQLNLLTGAAGTGKTFTVKSILSALLSEYSVKNIFITAFTGKAVINLINNFKTDSLLVQFVEQAMTIHKFLGYKPEFVEDPISHKTKRIFKPTYDSYNKRIDCKILIIDEVSMISKDLMNTLIAALDTRVLDKIILVGDINQLQPVIGKTAIAPFIANKHCCINTLTTIHRQADGNDIVLVADKIKKGNLVEIRKIAADNSAQNVKFLKAANICQLYQLIDKIVEKKNFSFNDARDCVITQCNVSASGQEILNNRLNKYLKIDRVPILAGSIIRNLGVGDNVLFAVNNYEEGYINGTFGKIISIAINGNSEPTNITPILPKQSISSDELENLVDDDLKTVPSKEDDTSYFATEASHTVTVGFTSIYGDYRETTISTIGGFSNLLLANAITCYKAQGSTYRYCIVNLVDIRSGNMINNEYFYTALTRASEKVFVIYNDSGLAKAMKNKQLEGITDAEKINNLLAFGREPLIDEFLEKWLGN